MCTQCDLYVTSVYFKRLQALTLSLTPRPNHNLNPNPISNLNLKTNLNSTPKSEDLNMVILGF